MNFRISESRNFPASVCVILQFLGSQVHEMQVDLKKGQFTNQYVVSVLKVTVHAPFHTPVKKAQTPTYPN